ncbi:Rieske (2Fe-2S) protein [Algoriphagus aestuarii]|nr:Rieske (2Fe-2S) protein [Algoriphagus aestuarii]
MKKFTLGTSKEQILSMINERSIKRVLVGDQKIALVRIGSEFFAFQAFCPHRGASLVEGQLNSINEIICPLHQYRFEIKSGRVSAGSCSDLETYPAFLAENGLVITLP